MRATTPRTRGPRLATSPGTWSSPTRPSTSRTPPRRPPAPCARSRPRPRRPHRHPGREQPHRALGDPRLGDPRAAGQPQRLPQGVGGADRVGRRPRPRDSSPTWSAVPAAPPQVRPRHRPRAARQDRDRPPARADPRAGRALRGVRARHDGADRARRRGDPTRPGARAAHRAEADLQPPGPVPQAVRRGAAHRPVRQARPARRAGRPRSWPRAERRWSSPSTSPWPGCSRPTSTAAWAPPPVPARRHPGARPRRDGRAVPGRRGAGVPAVAEGRRHRA